MQPPVPGSRKVSDSRALQVWEYLHRLYLVNIPDPGILNSPILCGPTLPEGPFWEVSSFRALRTWGVGMRDAPPDPATPWYPRKWHFPEVSPWPTVRTWDPSSQVQEVLFWSASIWSLPMASRWSRRDTCHPEPTRSPSLGLVFIHPGTGPPVLGSVTETPHLPPLLPKLPLGLERCPLPAPGSCPLCLLGFQLHFHLFQAAFLDSPKLFCILLCSCLPCTSQHLLKL